jgi:hypothetical protein
MLGLLLATVASACIVSGTPGFEKGSQKWCNTGLFEEVNVDASVEDKTFFARIHLNDKGWEFFNSNPTPFYLNAGNYVNAFWVKYGVTSTIQYLRDDKPVGECVAKKDSLAKCGPIKDESEEVY